LLLLCGVTLLFIAGCGDKSADTVVKKIEGTLEDLEGYKIAADMTMKTGKEDQQYEVDVWYKKGEEDFYRVGLSNKEDDDGQIILKNKDGVFVLTPGLKKSFKFQTDWPGNNSQPYLYQSLVEDVLTDKKQAFLLPIIIMCLKRKQIIKTIRIYLTKRCILIKRHMLQQR